MLPQRTIRLLVIEDNPAYRYLIQAAFAERGVQTHWQTALAKDGEEAMHVLFDEKSPLPDVILLDWNLPKVSGGNVLHRLKEHRTMRRIPVLVFSSSEADRDIQDAYDGHANGYVRKPDSVRALTDVVETIERFCTTVQLPKVIR